MNLIGTVYQMFFGNHLNESKSPLLDKSSEAKCSSKSVRAPTINPSNHHADIMGILRLEGVDANISSFLKDEEYSALKTTTRTLAGPITPIQYRQRWATKVYNCVAYCGMASEDEAPCVWQFPARQGSFWKDSFRIVLHVHALHVFVRHVVLMHQFQVLGKEIEIFV